MSSILLVQLQTSSSLFLVFGNFAKKKLSEYLITLSSIYLRILEVSSILSRFIFSYWLCSPLCLFMPLQFREIGVLINLAYNEIFSKIKGVYSWIYLGCNNIHSKIKEKYLVNYLSILYYITKTVNFIIWLIEVYKILVVLLFIIILLSKSPNFLFYYGEILSDVDNFIVKFKVVNRYKEYEGYIYISERSSTLEINNRQNWQVGQGNPNPNGGMQGGNPNNPGPGNGGELTLLTPESVKIDMDDDQSSISYRSTDFSDHGVRHITEQEVYETINNINQQEDPVQSLFDCKYNRTKLIIIDGAEDIYHINKMHLINLLDDKVEFRQEGFFSNDRKCVLLETYGPFTVGNHPEILSFNPRHMRAILEYVREEDYLNRNFYLFHFTDTLLTYMRIELPSSNEFTEYYLGRVPARGDELFETLGLEHNSSSLLKFGKNRTMVDVKNEVYEISAFFPHLVENVEERLTALRQNNDYTVYDFDCKYHLSKLGGLCLRELMKRIGG